MLKITVYPKGGGSYTKTFYSAASAKVFVDSLVALAEKTAQQSFAPDSSTADDSSLLKSVKVEHTSPA